MKRRGDLRQNLPCDLLAAMTVSALVTAAIGPTALASDAVAIPVDQAADVALLTELGERFSLARSKHFTLAYDADEKVAEQGLEWMEYTYRRVLHFCGTYELSVKPLLRRLEVVCSKDPERVGGPPVQSGFYDAASGRSYFAVSSRQGAQAALIEEMERLTVQHEVAHQLIDVLCPSLSANMPRWLSEGLACAFEVPPQIGIDGYRGLNEWRAKDAVSQFGSSNRDRNRRLTDVFTVAWDPKPGGAVTQQEFYSGAWSIVFYLQNERPESFKTYLHRLAESPQQPTHTEQVDIRLRTIGPLDLTLNRDVVGQLIRALHPTEKHHQPAINHLEPQPLTVPEPLSKDRP